MKNGFGLCLFMCMTLAGVSQASSRQAEVAFLEGNQAYQQGDYPKAIELYSSILTQGYESGPVYYNLGNCYYKLKDTGRAILNYERAKKWMPNDPDLKANMDLAQLSVIDKIVPQPRFILFRLVDGWIYLIPFTPLVWTMTILYLMSILFLILRILARKAFVARMMQRLCIAAGVVALLFMFSFFRQWQNQKSLTYAVILADKVDVMSAPGAQDGTEVFSLHEGTKVRIEKEAGKWVEILLEDGKVGWVPVEVLEEV